MLLALASCLALTSTVMAAEPTPGGQRVVYGGKLQDAQGRPIAGIYPLTFSFYKAEKGGKATWTESHFVAVDNGVYAVQLGGTKPFPKGVQLDKVWLGVALSGGTEILREKFAGNDLGVAPQPEVNPNVVAPAPNTVGVAPSKVGQTYADQAGYAFEAKKAETADSLGGLTADQLKELVKSGASAAGAKPKIGASKRYSEQVGGTGGNPYTLQCPPGHVVTGVKGGAAAYLDSLTLICSPLE